MDNTFKKAELLKKRSQYRDALTYYRRALVRLEGEDELACLMSMGDTYRMVGGFGFAKRYFERALALAKSLKNDDLALDCTVGLALSERGLGKWKPALTLLTEAEKKYRKSEDQEGLAFTLWALGGTHRIKGDLQKALDAFNQALEIFTANGHNSGVAYCLCGLGGASRAKGEFKDSLKYYNEANKLFKKLNDRFGKAYSHCGIGNAHRMELSLDKAREEFTKAAAIYNRIGDIVSYSYTLWSLGKTYQLQSRSVLAEKYFVEAEGNFKKTKDPRGKVYCKLGLAELRYAVGRQAAATRLVDAALKEAKKGAYALETCHAETLSAAIKGKEIPQCYEAIGVKLTFTEIPFNIP